MYDICIIGAGPAGISSAVYAASRGLDTVVLEEKEVGGRLGGVSTVTHYSGIIEGETGASFAERLKKQAESYGIEIRNEKVVSAELAGDVKKITTDSGSYEAKAVIIAAGTTPKKLGIPGEAELEGHGVGMNAAKAAKEYEGRDIFVVGGADGAVKEALFLAGYAKKLTIIHFEDQLGAIPEFTEKVTRAGNIELRLHTRLAELQGDGRVEILKLRDEHTKETETICCDGCGVFIYAGSTPNTGLYPELDQSDGYLVTDGRQMTSIPGVYAAGDICAKQVRQAATAVADGAVAAINAAAWCRSNE